MSGCSCTFDGFLFGVIPFGFNPSSGGHDEAGFKNALFGKSRLSGEIPTELGNLSRLAYLDLYGNDLSGCVPISLENQLDSEYSDLGDLPFC